MAKKRSGRAGPGATVMAAGVLPPPGRAGARPCEVGIGPDGLDGLDGCDGFDGFDGRPGW